MISFIIVLVMALETVFLDASVKHRNTLNAEIHRPKYNAPFADAQKT